jgi:RNA-directed DNA polymerase
MPPIFHCMADAEKEELLVALFRAYFDARKNKRNTINQLRFEINYEANIVELYEELLGRNYRLRPSIAFIVDKPVKREVLAADFRDRVIHHLLFNLINPVFEAGFITNSYSCRKGRGTHYGIQSLNRSIRSCSSNYRRDCYVLKLDIKGYFMSIDKGILHEKLRCRLLHSNALTGAFRDLSLYIIDVILSDDPVVNCRIRGSKSDWNGLPPTKSLFHSRQDCGLPIGNLTSQLFSNIYLDDFDHFVTDKLRFRHYGRYVDDFYLVHNDIQCLKNAIPLIREYLWSNTRLILHPDKVYLQHYTKGVNFLGATLKPGRLYVSKRTKSNFNRKMKFWSRKLANSDFSKDEAIKLRASINSYLGILMHYRSFNIRKKALLQDENLSFYKYGYIKWKFRKGMKFVLHTGS